MDQNIIEDILSSLPNTSFQSRNSTVVRRNKKQRTISCPSPSSSSSFQSSSIEENPLYQKYLRLCFYYEQERKEEEEEKLIPFYERLNHQCTSECDFFNKLNIGMNDYYICKKYGAIHRCNEIHCHHKIQEEWYTPLICELTGCVYSSYGIVDWRNDKMNTNEKFISYKVMKDMTTPNQMNTNQKSQKESLITTYSHKKNKKKDEPSLEQGLHPIKQEYDWNEKEIQENISQDQLELNEKLLIQEDIDHIDDNNKTMKPCRLENEEEQEEEVQWKEDEEDEIESEYYRIMGQVFPYLEILLNCSRQDIEEADLLISIILKHWQEMKNKSSIYTFPVHLLTVLYDMKNDGFPSIKNPSVMLIPSLPFIKKRLKPESQLKQSLSITILQRKGIEKKKNSNQNLDIYKELIHACKHLNQARRILHTFLHNQ